MNDSDPIDRTRRATALTQALRLHERLIPWQSSESLSDTASVLATAREFYAYLGESK